MNGKERTAIILINVLLVLVIGGGYVQSTPIVCPSKGQDQAQQNKDECECQQWAIQKSGVNPTLLVAQMTSGEVYQRHHTALGGGARGALVGVAIGAIAGDAGKCAAIGATAGGIGGGLKGRRDLEMQHQALENAHDEQQRLLQEYDRAYGACLAGRGYIVR